MTYRYVALGDSTSEGIGDIPHEDGTPRGWTDRLAAILARHHDGVEYANLAVRGLKSDQVLERQLEPARMLRPDLVTVSAGVNDLLRPSFTAHALRHTLDALVCPLVGDGAKVVLVPAPPVAHLMPLGPWRETISARLRAMNDVLAGIAADHDAIVPDTPDLFSDARVWATDRLHLNEVGHSRLARGVAQALGVGDDPDWDGPLTGVLAPRGRLDDLRWWVAFGTPWVIRRVRGRSSSDGRVAKRPVLGPVV